MRSIEELQNYSEMPDVIKEIADLWGEALAKEFHKTFAGALLYIPMHYSNSETITRLLLENKTTPVWKLSRDLNLSRNTIAKYLRQINDRRIKPHNKSNNKRTKQYCSSDAQCSLFD